MLIQVLGPVRAWLNGQELELGPPGRRAVLGLLALAGGKPLPRMEIVDALWGDRPPPSATNIIQTHVKHLRRLLDPERRAYERSTRIPTVGDGYALCIAAERLDVERFRELVATADDARRAGEADRAAVLLGAALRLWHGPPLADLPALAGYSRLLALAGERRDAVLAYGEAMITTGRATEVLPILTEAAAAQPLDEVGAALLVRAHGAAGQRARAFAVYDTVRRMLAEELGVGPGPALAQAHAMLLRDTPAPPGQTAAEPATVPAQLPGDVPGFTGRAAELAALDRLITALDRDPHAVAIAALCGTAGVGKTALAVHWGHRARDRFPDGQLYVNLRGYDPDQPVPTGEALARLLEGLGVAGADVPIDVDARAGRFRTEVADRRMLILLDNASSVEQLRPLLPGTPSCFVLVTSRDSLAGLVALHGAARIDLDLLGVEDAITLLHKLIGKRVTADPDAATELVEQCARLPLALRVAAELAVSRPASPMAELVGELTDRQRRLRLLDAGGDVRAAVRAVFSWSYRHLPAEAAVLFRRLGAHPGADADVHAVAALGRLDLDEAARLIDLLVRSHLVHRGPDGRIGMHDLLRAYALELAGANDSEADRSAALGRLLDHYLAATAAAMEVLYPAGRSHRPAVGVPDAPLPPITDPARWRSWLEAERANLVTMCAFAATHGWPSHAVRLATTLYRYLEGGHYADALAVHTHGLRAARDSGDRSGEAHALTNLGLVHRLLGEYGPAAKHLREAIDLYRLIGERNGEARALSNLGIVADRRGEYASADEHLQQALAVYRELDDRHGMAAVLTNLGGVHGRPGGYARAADHLTEARTLFRELGDRVGEASALVNLGDVELALGRHTEAAHRLEEALALFRDMSHRYGQAAALSNLGPVYTRLGRHEQAIEHLLEALDIFRATGHRYGEANTLNGLGEALHAADLPGALDQHTAALAIATETGDRDEQARARAGIANAAPSPFN